MKKVFNGYYLLSFLPVLAVLCIFFFFFKDIVFAPYSDYGREIYLPLEILKGKILYKDIIVEYPPLGYFLNALLFKIFGVSPEVLKYSGLFCSVLILFGIYNMCNLFTNQKTSVSLCLMLIFTCVYFPDISSYITPYSYSLLYAELFAVWCVYFLLRYFSRNKDIYLYLSCLFYGFSVITKYEFCFLIVAITIVYFIKKCAFKTIFKSFFFILFPVISVILIMLAQGASPNDLLSFVHYILRFTGDIYTYNLYRWAGIVPSEYSLHYLLKSLTFLPSNITFYSAFLINLIIFIFLCLKRDNKELLLLSLCSLLMSVKTSGGINFSIYGTFYFPVISVVIVSFIYSYFSKLRIPVLILNILYMSMFMYYDLFHYKYAEINTSFGKIKTFETYIKTTEDLINFINAETLPDDVVLILPAGSLINVLTNRKSDNKLYNITPPTYNMLGDKYVNDELKKENIKYIAITNFSYYYYNTGSFKRTFGKNTYEEILNNYTKVKQIGEDFQITVLVKNENL